MSAALKAAPTDEHGLPSDPAELAAKLADPMWRICSGAIYKILVKASEDDEGLVMPFIPNPMQRRFLRRFWNRNIILKARQLGFTTLICILWLDHALFNGDQRCGIIAHNREAAEAIFRDKVKFAYDKLPPVLREMFPLKSENKSEILFAHNNSNIRVATSVRSGTLNRLHISEFGKICAEYPHRANEIITGSIPSVPKEGILVIESTAEGREGPFYRMTLRSQGLYDRRAQLTVRDYRFHFSAWWEAEEYRLDPAGVAISPSDIEYFASVEARIHRQLDAEQRAWWVATRDADFSGDETQMMQEYPSYPEEAFAVSTRGTYYAPQLARARREGRITKLPFDARARVNTFWDLGLSDEMSIWLHQQIGPNDHFLGYYEAAGEPLSHYVRWLDGWARERGALWGKHHLPHDGAHRRPGTNQLKTYADMLNELGYRDIEIVPRIDDKTRGIQMVRDKFHTAWFDADGCKEGIEHLTHYRKEWNIRLGVWSDRPRHDEHSNGADAFRSWAEGYAPTAGYQKVDRSRQSWRTT